MAWASGPGGRRSAAPRGSREERAGSGSIVDRVADAMTSYQRARSAVRGEAPASRCTSHAGGSIEERGGVSGSNGERASGRHRRRALRRPAGPRPHVRPRARRARRGRRSSCSCTAGRRRQRSTGVPASAAGRQLPRPRRRPPRPRTRAAQPRTVPTRGLCRRHRHAPPRAGRRPLHRRRLLDGRADRPAPLAAPPAPGRRARPVRRPRRRSTGPRTRERAHRDGGRWEPRRRGRVHTTARPGDDDGAPRLGGGASLIVVGARGDRRTRLGAGSSRPVGSCAASTRGRGCATRPSRPPSSPRDDDVVPHGRQLALAEAIPGATVRAVGGGHSACTVGAGHFVPALVDACMEVAERATRPSGTPAVERAA